MATIHTANDSYHLVQKEFYQKDSGHVYVPYRESAYNLAVFNNEDECVGYISCDTLGCKSVKDWQAKTKWKDQGY